MDLRPVVITGGAGFLGEHLTRAFLAAGTPVRVFDSASRPEWTAATNAEYFQGDVRDSGALRRAANGATAIVHAAFVSPRQKSDLIRVVNVEGTANVLAAARETQVPRVVLVSSTIVTGPPRTHPLWSDSPLGRLDLYRTTRIDAERQFNEASRSGISTAIVRPQSFLGQGRLGAFGIIFELIRTGDAVPILGDGRHRYQLLGVQDLADGIRLLTSNTSTGVFAFGARDFSTVRKDLQALIDRAGSTSRLRHLPAPLGKAGLRWIELAGLVPLSEWHRQSAWSRDSVADCSRAEQELGWRPQRSNVDALAEAYEWYTTAIRSTGSANRTHPLPRAHAFLRYILRVLPRS